MLNVLDKHVCEHNQATQNVKNRAQPRKNVFKRSHWKAFLSMSISNYKWAPSNSPLFESLPDSSNGKHEMPRTTEIKIESNHENTYPKL